MNFDAGRFQIGVVELFAVLLPGALLSYVLHPLVLPLIGVDQGLDWQAHTVTVFLVVSYVTGHVVHLLGSKLDGPIDVVREHRWMKSGTGVRQRFGRACLNLLGRALLVKEPSRAALDAVADLKLARLGAHGSRAVMNAFQWAKAVLALNKPGLLPAVQRHEADSKFFRSFLIVLLILFGLQLGAFLRARGGLETHEVFAPLPSARDPLAQRAWVLAGILGLAWLSAVCYIDQRTKSIDLTFRYVIALAAEAPRAVDHPLTHAGGVVVRVGSANAPEVLLVSATREVDKLVLPKGHIEPGEHPQATAMREVAEETGVAAKVIDPDPLLIARFHQGSEQVRVAYFLMVQIGTAVPGERRRVHWTAEESASEALTEHGAVESAQAVRLAMERWARIAPLPAT